MSNKEENNILDTFKDIKNNIVDFLKNHFDKIDIGIYSFGFILGICLIILSAIFIYEYNRNRWKKILGKKQQSSMFYEIVDNCTVDTKKENTLDSTCFKQKFRYKAIFELDDKKKTVDLESTTINIPHEVPGYYKNNNIETLVLIEPLDYTDSLDGKYIAILVFGCILTISSGLLFGLKLLNMFTNNSS